MHHNGLYKAIRYFGSQRALAQAIGVTQQTISLWVNKTNHIPYKHVLKIISATRCYVTQHELVPGQREMNEIVDDLMQMRTKSSLPNFSLNIPIQNKNDIDEQEKIEVQYDLVLPWLKQLEKELIINTNEEKIMMRDYSKISPQFWVGATGREIRELGIEARMLAIYLLSCPHANMVGIYYLPVDYIVHDIRINKEEILNALHRLISIGFCSFDTKAEYIWVHEMAKHQICSYLSERDKRVKAVNDIFHSLPNLTFLNDFYEKYKDIFHLQPRIKQSLTTIESALANSSTTPVVKEKICLFEGPSKTLRSQEQEQEQEQEHEHEQDPEEIKLKQTEKRIDMSVKPDVNVISNVHSEKSSSTTYEKPSRYHLAIEVLEFLNQKTGREYRPVTSNLKLIIGCLRSGATIEQCRQVIAKKCRDWKKDPKMMEYLRPATLFNPIKFEQYLGELVWPNKVNDDKNN